MSFSIMAIFQVAILLTSTAQAASSSTKTFGIEFTAIRDSHSEFTISDPNLNFVQMAADLFAKRTNTKTIRQLDFNGKTGISVRTNVGSWFFHNDGGALEVSSPVFKLGAIESNSLEASEIDTLFEVFKRVGLNPEIAKGGIHGGGGHIHVGRTPFINDPRLLRNFVVFLRTTGLFADIFGEIGDAAALPPYDTVYKDSYEEYKEAIAELDAEFKAQFEGRRRKLVSVEEVIWALSGKSISTMKSQGEIIGCEPSTDFRFGGLLLAAQRATQPLTLEVRNFKAPKNRLEVIRRLRLLDRLIDQLKSLPKGELVANQVFGESTIERKIRARKILTMLDLNPEEYAEDLEEASPVLANFGTNEIRLKTIHPTKLNRPELIELEMIHFGSTAPKIEIISRAVRDPQNRIHMAPQFRRSTQGPEHWFASVLLPSSSLEASLTDTFDMREFHTLPGMMIVDKSNPRAIKRHLFKLGNLVYTGPYAQSAEIHSTRHTDLCEALFALPTH